MALMVRETALAAKGSAIMTQADKAQGLEKCNLHICSRWVSLAASRQAPISGCESKRKGASSCPGSGLSRRW